MHYSGSPCPEKCGGYLFVRTTKPAIEGERTRYFECRKCGCRCSCEVPEESVRRRKRAG